MLRLLLLLVANSNAQVDADSLYWSARFDEAAAEYRKAIMAKPAGITAAAGLVIGSNHAKTPDCISFIKEWFGDAPSLP